VTGKGSTQKRISDGVRTVATTAHGDLLLGMRRKTLMMTMIMALVVMIMAVVVACLVLERRFRIRKSRMI